MIKAIQSIESLEAPLRRLLISQSQLDGNHVLNALSIRGPAMQKPKQTQGEMIFESFGTNESVIVFELSEIDESNSEKEETAQEDVLFTVIHLELKIIVYGTSSRTLSQKVKSRFASSAIRDECYKNGLNLLSISNIENASEYINDVLWQRRDFSIIFNCHLDVSEITPEQNFDNTVEVEVDRAQD